jgi:hypothetical protein
MVTKALSRGLISNDEFVTFEKDINEIGVKLNNYINSIEKNNKNK